jgi:hypothetical protein
LEYALQRTSARWIYRGCDDTVINFINFWAFIRHIERTFDPLHEKVILGNCLQSPLLAYLQGGSGMLLSRYAAQLIAPLATETVRNMTLLDDLELGRVLPRLGIEISTATSTAFCGHSFKNQLLVLRWGRLSSFPRCPRLTEIPGSCQPFLARLRDIVFYHEYPAQPLVQVIKHAGLVFNADPRLHWWVENCHPFICVADPRYSIEMP